MNTAVQTQSKPISASVENTERSAESVRALRLSSGQEWRSLRRELSAGVVEMTPANAALGEHFSSYGTSGAASEAIKVSLADFPARAPNLWVTRFSTPGGLVQLEYLRSGTVARYGERDIELRRAASEVAAGEVLEAARLVAERSGARALSVVSIDLQTPDGWEGELEIERETVREHAAAFAAAAACPLPLGDAVVSPSVTSLVMPTHEGSYRRGGEEWRLGAATMAATREIAARARETAPAELRAALEIFIADTEKLAETEARNAASPAQRFAFGARVALLSALAGDVLHFSCRSGKDRTGFFDVELKFAAYQLERLALGLPVSTPGSAVLPEESAAWRDLLLESGNREIQKLNTGFTGSKLDHGFLKERVGAELWEEFVGESRRSRS